MKAVVAIVALFVPAVWVVAVELPKAIGLENVGVPVKAMLPENVGAPMNVPLRAALVKVLLVSVWLAASVTTVSEDGDTCWIRKDGYPLLTVDKEAS